VVVWDVVVRKYVIDGESGGEFMGDDTLQSIVDEWISGIIIGNWSDFGDGCGTN
jgi:hypothetical protein